MRKAIFIIGLAFAILLIAVSMYFARVRDNTQQSQMFVEVLNGNFSAVKKLVDDNPSLVNAESRDDMFRESVLNMAIQSKHKDIAEFLIRNGTDVNYKESSCYYMPLHWAAEWGDIDVIRLLLEKGADINGSNLWEVTPIVIAVHAGNKRAVDLLKANGAKPGSRIHEAAAFGDLQTVKEELMRNPDSKENENRPIDLAAKNGHKGIVSFLIAKRAPISPSALVYAAESGHLETVKVLVSNGADINGKDNEYGYTPLHRAAENGRVDIARYLLAHGADPSIKSQGCTASELAEEKGHKEMAEFLKKHTRQSKKSPSSADSADQYEISTPLGNSFLKGKMGGDFRISSVESSIDASPASK